MNDRQYRDQIDELKNMFAHSASGKSVGIIVPAAMEMVLNVITAIENKDDALAATRSLRPMINYIEGQLRGTH